MSLLTSLNTSLDNFLPSDCSLQAAFAFKTNPVYPRSTGKYSLWTTSSDIQCKTYMAQRKNIYKCHLYHTQEEIIWFVCLIVCLFVCLFTTALKYKQLVFFKMAVYWTSFIIF